MATPLDITTLRNALVRLEPLATHHVEGLVLAANEDRSNYGFTSVPQSRTDVQHYVDDLLRRHASGETAAFAQVDETTQRVLGVTRYLTFRAQAEEPPYAVEIGGTWLAASAQRTRINSAAKLLLFTHAFDQWRVVRVDLKTDARNARSRTAIERLGCTFEGVLRNWQPSQVPGEELLYRDSAMYSVVRSQWPALRAQLETSLHDSASSVAVD